MDKPTQAVAVVDEGVAEQMRFFGFREESVGSELAKAQAVQPDEDFEVWEENWESWTAYMRSQTQWLYRQGGLGPPRRSGLNYPGVESGLRMAGVPRRMWAALFADIVAIELAVLEADVELALQQADSD